MYYVYFCGVQHFKQKSNLKQRKMKKVLITMAVLTSMVAGAMVFSSFATQKQDAEIERVQKEVNVPAYWTGRARTCNDGWLDIEVYQTEGQCNSFYAKVTNADYEPYIGKELWVKQNPRYDPNNRYPGCSEKKYFVTCGCDYYFDM